MSDYAARVTDERFWHLIAMFDWEKTGDDDAVIEPAVAALAAMPKREIRSFEDLLAERLYLLDTEAHARNIGEYAYTPNSGFSVDWFLYVRCCVVANGRDFYKAVLADPLAMPKDMEFESLLYVATKAHERKTGKPLDYDGRVSYETFSNERGWR